MADTERDARILKKLRDYVDKLENTDYDLPSSRTGQAYEKNLTKTLQELKKQHAQETAKLEKLRATTGPPFWDSPASDPLIRLPQLHLLTTAFRSLSSPSHPAPFPKPTSPLPSLLAARSIHSQALSTQASIPTTLSHLSTARADLASETAELQRATQLRSLLEKRVALLREQHAHTATQTVEEKMQDFLAKEQEMAKRYKREHKKLTAALVRFVENRLATLIAAEELGGPVAGSTLDVGVDELAAGFDRKGRGKKKGGKLEGERRQRRLDGMFGFVRGENSGGDGGRGDGDEDEDEDETTRAAMAVKDLLGDLLQVAVDHGSGRYVSMERETAASRFLVRVKAAELDVRDARRIRLVDFAKGLDD